MIDVVEFIVRRVLGIQLFQVNRFACVHAAPKLGEVKVKLFTPQGLFGLGVKFLFEVFFDVFIGFEDLFDLIEAAGGPLLFALFACHLNEDFLGRFLADFDDLIDNF